jgi:hypothetical protein
MTRLSIEAAIQRAVVAFIADSFPDVKVIAPMNENSRHSLPMGVDVGCPDLILLRRKDGQLFVYFLELKTKKGRLRDTQKDWAADYEKRFACANTYHAVAYGFSAAKQQLLDWFL